MRASTHSAAATDPPGVRPPSHRGGGRRRPPRPPRRNLAVLGRLALVLVLLAVAGGVVVLLGQRSDYGGGAGPQGIPALEVEPAPVELGTVAQPTGTLPSLDAVLPQPAGAPVAPGRDPNATLTSWANSLAGRIDVPARALVAYARADVAMRQQDPSCHFSWVTVAGLARIESNHGRYGGSHVAPNGDVTPRIIGVPLNGTAGNRTIGDTDHGILDGDPTLDRAVGPLQFIPSTWAHWRSDGNNDGVADPNNIDDAALAAGRYLCANGQDLATGPGWRAAVLSYNNSDDYGRRVYAAAQAYSNGARIG